MDDRDDPFGDIFDEIERMMGDSHEDPTDVHVTTYHDDGQVRVVADLPEVSADGVTLQCDGEVLTIRVEGGGRRAGERVRLPTRVDEHSADASFNNGVLDVTFEAIGDSADIDIR